MTTAVIRYWFDGLKYIVNTTASLIVAMLGYKAA